jgi:DNA-binding transcriptional MerR regulator
VTPAEGALGYNSLSALKMSESAAAIEIPNRALFKAAEVCDLVKVQPYVLRSWEAEFPDLGVSKAAGGPRIYRRTDVEQVVRIKHLLLVEGLTLAGARRKLEEDSTPVAADVPVIDELIGRHARERLTEVKRGLRSILDLLSGKARANEFRLTPQAAPSPSAPRRTMAARGKTPRGKAVTGRRQAPSRRKRSD